MASAFPVAINALHAIEIVARTGALAPAADELGVTPGAVSQHLRRAEERLGVTLFERTPKGLVPTADLKQIMPLLSSGFSALHEAVGALRRGDDNTLTLTVASVFASRWLVWRLTKFTALHPDIELRLVVNSSIIDLAHSDVDCGIRFGRGDWPGIKGELIGGTVFRPVCAPALAEQLKTPIDLTRVPVIRDSGTMLSWDVWWRAAGFEVAPQTHGPTFSSGLAFDAAISGQGVLLTVDMMTADAVSDGRLARPFDIAAEGDVGYYLVIAEGRREPKKVRAFREWLHLEVPASMRGYVHQHKTGT